MWLEWQIHKKPAHTISWCHFRRCWTILNKMKCNIKYYTLKNQASDCQLKIWSNTQSVTNSWTRKRWKQQYIVRQNPYLWDSVNNKTLNLPLLLIKICLVFKNMSESQKCYGEITSTSFNTEFMCNTIVVKAVSMSIQNYKYLFQAYLLKTFSHLISLICWIFPQTS